MKLNLNLIETLYTVNHNSEISFADTISLELF